MRFYKHEKKELFLPISNVRLARRTAFWRFIATNFHAKHSNSHRTFDGESQNKHQCIQIAVHLNQMPKAITAYRKNHEYPSCYTFEPVNVHVRREHK